MRIKEEIKRSGFFWLPSSPENQISGTLFISDGGNIKLELSEPLNPSIQAQLGPTHPDSLNPILGHVEKDGPVRIDQCYRVLNKRNFTHGRLIAPLVIQADRAFMGLPCKEDASLRFNTFSFSVEGIDEWVGISGIKVDTQFEKSATTILYNRPEDISFNLNDDIQMLITFGWTPPRFPWTKRAEVSQKTFFKLISKDPCELDEFISVAQKITAFLCFIMNEIVSLNSISATSDSIYQKTDDDRTVPIPVKIYYPSWPYAKDEPEINDFGILFKYIDKQTHAESIINKWIDNYEQIAPAFDLYFMTKAGTLPSLNLQFLTLAQALEAFHLRISGEQVSLRNRFEQMTELFASFMCGENRSKLLKKIVKTRNYLTHNDPKLESKAAKGKELQFICLKMDALFRLQFLKLIGFNEREIDDIVDKCLYLKRQCNLNPYLSDKEKMKGTHHQNESTLS